MPALAGEGGTVCAGTCCCIGGVHWDQPSAVPATGSALEGCLSPGKEPAVDCEEVSLA